MKKYLTTLLIISVTTAYGYGQSCPKPEPLSVNSTTGTWKGAYSQNGEFIDFTLKVKKSKDGLTATIDIPKVKVKGVTYEAKICQGQELHIKNRATDSTVEFIGRPREDGVMSGQVIFREKAGNTIDEVFTAKRTSLIASK